MARTVSIGAQGFEELRTHNAFYVDKTAFISEWWSTLDKITLITRPRRFGKTLLLDTVRCFFSTEFAERGEELFGGLDVWDDPELRELQGTIPVVFLSFADIKHTNYADTMYGIKELLREVAKTHSYLLDSESVDEGDKTALRSMSSSMSDAAASKSAKVLCQALEAHWGVKPVVLLDEYDTPMQAAWLGGYWDELSAFMRVFMDSTFKTNPSLDRGLMTGITRVSRESIFSGLNNLRVCSVTSSAYATSFGFTEHEVFSALDEFDMQDRKAKVKEWYDGFCFGEIESIYNPWSITLYLEEKVLVPYWMNTSDNALVADLVRRGDTQLKQDFEDLLDGRSTTHKIDDQLVFSDLEADTDAVWSLLLSSGYITPVNDKDKEPLDPKELRLTNKEVFIGFDSVIERWFGRSRQDYNGFIKAILTGDERFATRYLQEVTLSCMSYFDGATRSAQSEPERFYHGLVLGLLASLRGHYTVESNRESGWGRYDIMLVPTKDAQATDKAIIIEFKVFDKDDGETALEDTATRALAQIEERAYATALIERGFSSENILSYGIAFRGKEVLVVQT